MDWVSTSDDATVYVEIHNGSGPRLVRSTDGGVTWVDLFALAQRGAGGLAHANALYISAGVVVAAQVWDQRGDPELDSVVSVSPDQGSTWIPVPPPA